MKNLGHILVFVLSVLQAGTASAQINDRLITEIITAASDACITLTYSLDSKVDDAKVSDSGTVTVQDDLWFLKGAILEIYTCQEGTWILYPESREAMVEPRWTYDDLKTFYGTLISSSGNEMELKVTSKVISEKKPVSYFVPETGSDWVVTDLR